MSNEQELKATLLRAMDQQARRKARLVGAATAVIAAWILSMFLFYDSCSTGPAPGTVSGSFSLDLAPAGAAKLTGLALRCYSGHGHKYRGVELVSADGNTVLQIHEDEIRGSFVKLLYSGQTLFLSPERCTTFGITLRAFEGRNAGGLGFNGSLEVICQLPEGQVEAHLQFSDCSD